MQRSFGVNGRARRECSWCVYERISTEQIGVSDDTENQPSVTLTCFASPPHGGTPRSIHNPFLILVLPSLILPAQYSWSILPIPPAPTVFDQRVVDVGAIEQKHVSKGAPVLVLAVGLKDDIFPED